jgi:hypothetical protein
LGVSWIISGFIAAIAVVTGWHKIFKIDGIKRIKSFWKVMIVCLSPCVVNAEHISYSTKWTFAGGVYRHECLIVLIQFLQSFHVLPSDQVIPVNKRFLKKLVR